MTGRFSTRSIDGRARRFPGRRVERSGASSPRRARGGRHRGLVLVLALACLAATLPLLARDDVPDLLAGSRQPVVLFFVAADCPISDRYAPEILRLRDHVVGIGGAAHVVYTGVGATGDVGAHAARFGYGTGVIADPATTLARRARIETTPEAAVFVSGRLVYSGRIDDRVVRFGVVRPTPTRRDLVEAIARARAGADLAFARVPASAAP